MKQAFFIIFIFYTNLNATGTWMWNNRTHGELKWTTIETKNFNVHYHQGIREIALKGASIAEQVRPTLIKQMNLDTLPKLDIVLTSEDEILNGFALPANYTIIWVDQNDASLWSGDEKWLRTVLAHELQHLVYNNTVKGPWWLPEPMNYLAHRTPAWLVEGMAEYYTEKWRPWRFEMSHRGHVIRNTVSKIRDPHNDGFSKTLYLADRFGDSTITKILNFRNKLGYLDFEHSFKKHTGITVKQFNEDWRRLMNTFYYGQRSQKETLNEAGLVRKLPVKRVVAFDYFSDTNRIAIVGQLSKGQGDLSLILATRDTLKEKKTRKKRLKKSKKTGKKPKKVKPIWKLKELDHGRFGEINNNLDVSPDGEKIVYPKYGYGKNQSLGYDIYVFDLLTKKKTVLIKSKRANYPKFSPDGKSILFVAHKNSTSQLYTMNMNSNKIKQITNNQGDVQIITPNWKPDGKAIAFAMSGEDGQMDIYVIDIQTRALKQITDSAEADAFPVWHPDSEQISYTGYYNNSPNLYTYNFKTNQTVQNTDLWNMYWSMDWNKELSTVTAMTLNTVDSSRVVEIDPSRSIEPTKITMNSMFYSWRNKTPDHSISNINSKSSVEIVSEKKYNFIKHLRHLGTFVFPDERSLFYQGAFTDALGRHSFGATIFTDYDSLNSLYFQYQNSSGFPIDFFWGLDIYNDANFQLQFYNKNRSYIEVYNGASIWIKMPYNFGRSQSVNHIFLSSLQFVNRNIISNSPVPSNTVFEKPDIGNESSLKFSYIFLKKRQHQKNMLSPDQGVGLSISYKNATSQLWGVFDYNKLRLDTYTNLKIGPFVLYGRGQYEIVSGNSPNQETPAIVDIPNYYLMGTITPGREYMAPRGFSGKPRFGNRAFMGTIELRTPILPVDFLELLNIIKLGSPTFALVSDFGDAWDSKLNIKKSVMTYGFEFRTAFKIANMPVIILGYGFAQKPSLWSKQISPDSYLKMTLINPF